MAGPLPVGVTARTTSERPLRDRDRIRHALPEMRRAADPSADIQPAAGAEISDAATAASLLSVWMARVARPEMILNDQPTTLWRLRKDGKWVECEQVYFYSSFA